MNTQIAGHCGQCGAPYFMPSMWHGVNPPTPTPTCACWNLPRTTTSNTYTIRCNCHDKPKQTSAGCPLHGVSYD